MSQRNSPERAQMLDARAHAQYTRRPQYHPRLTAFSARINRHTGKPHEHARAKARRLRQIGAA